ncbi:MAG: Gfo/Idh/MocA family oxidoreductase [candidate division NC10 bacterium]|nr:Gfo/Idh/MocA family oxidoreductase [candidate division NC10 bacterium]
MTGKRIRFGLIGLGRHGSRYARHLLDDLPEAELVAVCRQDTRAGQEFAEAKDIAFYADYRDLLSDERLDAVAVVVPPDLNAEICAAAVRRGLSFVVEKPLAHTLTDAQRILKEAQGGNVKGLVAQTLRFDSVVQTLKSHLPVLGALHSILIEQHFEPSPLAWLDEAERGGIILHTGVHGFDLLRFLTGAEVVQVYCKSYARFTRKTEDGFSAILEMKPGPLQAVVTNLRTTLGRIGRIEVIGEYGILAGDHIHHSLHRIQGRETHPLPLPPPVPTVLACLKSFVTWLTDNIPPPVSLGDGLRALAAVDACRRSAATGVSVATDERSP